MVGDYISTSFAGGPLAFPVFAIAKPPTDGVFDECAAGPGSSHDPPGRKAGADASRPVRYRQPVRPPSRTLDITLPPPSPRVKTRREPIGVGRTGIPKTRR